MGATPTREDADATLNISIHAPAWGATGSPPLTRGKEHHVAQQSPADRITPAYAGKRRAQESESSFLGITPAYAGKS